MAFLVGLDLLLQAIELGERLLAVVRDHGSLRRIVAVDEVGRERVDARLQGVGVGLIAIAAA